MLDALRQDIAYALRGIRRNPGFAIAVAGTLALGLGANAAMFSLVDRMLFRPPALMKDPATAHRVYVYQSFRGKENAGGVSMYARYQDLTRWTTSFAATAGFTQNTLAVGTGEQAREMQIGVVSASFFGFFDSPPAAGRYFTTAEDTVPTGAAVAVLSWGMWQTEFGGRKEALGKTIQIGPTLYTIVGVTPQGFAGLWPDQPPVAFIPITSFAAAQAAGTIGQFLKARHQNWWETYNWGWMQMMVRRKPGVTEEVATADLTQAMIKSYRNYLVTNPRGQPLELAKPRAIAASILAERGPRQSSVAKVAAWLGGVSLIVLLIACANVANLLLARAFRRRREIAVRLALGVTHLRLLSQLLTESVLLASLGGAAGVIVAQWLSHALQATFFSARTAPASVVADSRTLWFAAGAALLAGVVAGLAPVWQARRTDFAADLKAGAREGTYHRSKARIALLVAQGALSVLLLLGAGLFVRSLDHVKSVPLGYEPDPVLLVNPNYRGVDLDSATKVALRLRLLEAAKAQPGVTHASLQAAVPFWSMTSFNLFVEGIDSVSKLGEFQLNRVSRDYFATMGTRIVRGRGILDSDNGSSPLVAVVSEAMARVLWPQQDALGKCMKLNADTMPCTTVVGIAENIHATKLGADSTYYYYLPAMQSAPQQGGLFVRVGGTAEAAQAAIEPLRKRLQREMPGAAYVTVTPFTDVLGEQMKSFSLGATMFAAFGLLALAVAAVGLYSVMAYNVAQRTHELGVRVALGAQVRDLVRLVVGEGAKFGAAGVAIGAGIALAAGRWVKPLLFDESPRDPAVFTFVAVALMLVALAASWIPAMRASRVDPNEALRAE